MNQNNKLPPPPTSQNKRLHPEDHSYSPPAAKKAWLPYSYRLNSDSPPLNDSQPLYTNGKPQKGRIRVAKACDRCKHKKTKCDGMNPCKSCVKHNLQCIYTPSTFVKAVTPALATVSDPDAISAKSLSHAVEIANEAETMPEKRTAIIDANKPAILARMRDRITVLENDLARVVQRLNDTESTTTFIEPMDADQEDRHKLPPILVSPNPMIGSSKLQSSVSKSSGYVESENPAENTGMYESTNKPQKLKQRYSRRYANYLPYRMGVAFTKNLPQRLKEKVTVPRVQCYGWNMSGVHYLKPRNIPASTISLPEQLSRRLLTYFFNNINPLYAILHQPMFMEQYDSYVLSPDRSECRLFMAILHIVCAITLRFTEITENIEYEPGLEEKLFDDAYDTLQAFSFEWESLEIIQGYLLMCFYLRTCHRQPAAWGVLGTAIRMVAGMGLMHKMEWSSFKNEYDALKHERVFWACFVMDRMLCIDCGRHFSFREDSMTIPIPHYFVDDGWQTPVSNALLRLCLALEDLVSDVKLDLNSSILISITSRLKSWNEGMADFNLNSDTDLNKFNLPPALIGHLRLCYYNALYFIHMRVIYGLIGARWDATFMNRSLFVECVQGVVTIATTLQRQNQLITPWWLTMSTLFHSGCVSLLLIYNEIETLEMAQCLNTILEVLQQMDNDSRFKMAKECVWSLKTLSYMVRVKLTQTQQLLANFVTEAPGPSAINKGNFSSMGIIDSQGNEVMLINVAKDSGPKQSVGVPNMDDTSETEASDVGNNWVQSQIDQFQLSFPFLFNTIDVSPLSEPSETQMSLDWFSSWGENIDLTSNS